MRRAYKKIVATLVVTVLLFGTAGCGKKSNSDKNYDRLFRNTDSVDIDDSSIDVDINDNGQGNMTPDPIIDPGNVVNFKNQIVTDSMGIDSWSVYLPDGWTAKADTELMVCEWHTMRSGLTLTSPDGTCGILIQTPMVYVDQVAVSDGQRTPDDESHYMLSYCTYLHKRDAGEYIDYFLGRLGYSFANYTDMPVDNAALNQFKSDTQTMLQSTVDSINNAGVTQNQGLSSECIANGSDASICIRRGSLTSGLYIEARSAAHYIDYSLRTYAYSTIGSYATGYDTVLWKQFGTVVYWANNETIFNENLDIANFIIDNATNTDMFAAAQQQIYDTIIPQVIAGNIEMFNYAMDTINSVIQNFSETNDRVAQAWDDYILDQNRYTLPNGTQIIVPSDSEYVYADSNGNIIWSDSAGYDPGPGYTRVN